MGKLNKQCEVTIMGDRSSTRCRKPAVEQYRLGNETWLDACAKHVALAKKAKFVTKPLED